jgi:hypothetical protein
MSYLLHVTRLNLSFIRHQYFHEIHSAQPAQQIGSTDHKHRRLHARFHAKAISEDPLNNFKDSDRPIRSRKSLLTDSSSLSDQPSPPLRPPPRNVAHSASRQGQGATDPAFPHSRRHPAALVLAGTLLKHPPPSYAFPLDASILPVTLTSSLPRPPSPVPLRTSQHARQQAAPQSAGSKMRACPACRGAREGEKGEEGSGGEKRRGIDR